MVMLSKGTGLNFDAMLKADLSWNSLMYSIPQELLRFLLNSTHNVLPTSDNLKRWGKTVVDLKCRLCGFLNPTLKHVLNGCSMALKQGMCGGCVRTNEKIGKIRGNIRRMTRVGKIKVLIMLLSPSKYYCKEQEYFHIM